MHACLAGVVGIVEMSSSMVARVAANPVEEESLGSGNMAKTRRKLYFSKGEQGFYLRKHTENT
jgi:hypothetical protein